MIRVLIADDHLVVREGLGLILGMEPDLEVVGEAVDGAMAIRLTESLQPDVVLMDLRMPGMGGLEAIGHIRRQWPDVALVILTTYNEDELMVRGLQAGANGFLLKDTGRQMLFDTIRAAARGETLLSPEILQRVMNYTAVPAPTPPTKNPRNSETESPLTERELEVLTAVAQGHTSKAIATKLGVTERTIKAHLTNIYNKLGVDSRAAAVAAALQKNLLS